jgi:hypothetical protein
MLMDAHMISLFPLPSLGKATVYVEIEQHMPLSLSRMIGAFPKNTDTEATASVL